MRHTVRSVMMALPVLLAGATGVAAYDASSSADRAALRERAYAECRKPEYPVDTKIRINYAKGWFRCDLPEWYNHKGHRKR